MILICNVYNWIVYPNDVFLEFPFGNFCDKTGPVYCLLSNIVHKHWKAAGIQVFLKIRNQVQNVQRLYEIYSNFDMISHLNKQFY